MMKNVRGTIRPMSYGVLKRVCLALVVLLVASALLVGAGSAESTNTVYVEDSDALKTAIQNVGTNDPTTLVLAKGSYTFPTTGVSLQNKIITFFNDTKEVTIDMTNVQETNQFVTGATLTFEGIQVDWKKQNTGNHGLANAKKVVYKNCIITGTQFMGGDADFIDCTFESGKNADGSNYDGYCVYGRGSGDLTFTDCTFNTGGRAIMLYNDAPVEINVTLTRCNFHDITGAYTSKVKAAVETGDNENDPAKTSVFRITFNDCTVDEGSEPTKAGKGFEPNNSDSPLWGDKDLMMTDGRLTVNFVRTVTWQIGNDQTSEQVPVDTVPTYTGTIPTKTADEQYYYTFKGWTPTPAEGTASATYTAVFNEISKEGKEGKPLFPLGIMETDNNGVTTTQIAAAGNNKFTVTGDTATIEDEKGIATLTITFKDGRSNTDGAIVSGEIETVTVEYLKQPVNITVNTIVTDLPIITSTDEQEIVGSDWQSILTIMAIETDAINDALAADTDGKITITFSVPKADIEDMSKIRVLHVDENGVIKEELTIPDDKIADKGTDWEITVEGTSFSSYILAKPYVAPPSTPTTPQGSGSSSHSHGSSVWLMANETPTEQPTTSIDTVPTDIPTTEPTETPASPAFGALAALAGLGAVAVLRRK